MNVLLILLASFTTTFAQSGPRTRVKASALVRQALGGCETELARVSDSVENALKQLDARRAAAYLGTYHELEDLLSSAGVGRARAGAVREVLHHLVYETSSRDPELSYLIEVLRMLIEHEQIFVCVTSTRCSIAAQQANHIVFTGVGRQAVQIVSPLTESPRHFAINFVAANANLSGERKLLRWALAGQILERLHSPLLDPLHRQFTGLGTGATKQTDVDQGFSITFLTLYYALQAHALFTHYFPELAAKNLAHLNDLQFKQLTEGPLAFLTAPVVTRLNLQRARLLPQAAEILRLINRTIAQGEHILSEE